MSEQVIEYHNLSQSVGERMVYLRSTDIEQHNYHRLLWSVPDEWFFLWSQGHKVLVIDVSSNKGKIEHIFLPVLQDIINALFFGISHQNNNLAPHHHFAFDALRHDRALLRKYKHWKYLTHKPVEIIGRTLRVPKEPNLLEQERTYERF